MFFREVVVSRKLLGATDVTRDRYIHPRCQRGKASPRPCSFREKQKNTLFNFFLLRMLEFITAGTVITLPSLFLFFTINAVVLSAIVEFTLYSP